MHTYLCFIPPNNAYSKKKKKKKMDASMKKILQIPYNLTSILRFDISLYIPYVVFFFLFFFLFFFFLFFFFFVFFCCCFLHPFNTGTESSDRLDYANVQADVGPSLLAKGTFPSLSMK